MKLRWFLALTALVLGSFSLAGAQSVYIDHVDGLIDADHVNTDTEITFHIGMTADGTGYKGLTNGWQIWSPTGAEWDTTTYEFTDALSSANFDLLYQLSLFPLGGPIGSGADTVALGAAVMFQAGMPSDFAGITHTITIGPIDASYAGGEICIDSSWYQPGNEWKWADASSQIVFPSWSGQECYTIGAGGEPPVITCPGSATGFDLCAAEEVCIDVPIEGEGVTVTVTPDDAVWASDQLCWTPTGEGSFAFSVVAENDHGADTCEVIYVINYYDAVSIDCPTEAIDVQLAEAGEVCVDLPVLYASTVTADFGTWANDELCFTADTAGTYTITVDAEGTPSECEFTDQCILTVNVEFVVEPSIDCPEAAIDLTPCSSSGNLCIDLPIINAETVEVTSGGGTWADDELCFDYDGSGTFNFSVVATSGEMTDECDITVNVAPTPLVAIDCPASDVEITLAGAGDACTDLTITNYDVVTVTGGTWDDGTLCVDAQTEGTYPVSVEATSTNPACPSATCDFNIIVTFESGLAIECPAEAFDEEICDGSEVCVPLTILNAETVTPSAGTWADGQLCYTPASEGDHTITVIATAGADADTCDVTINVTFIDGPTITCPSNSSETICAGEEICVDVPVANATEVTSTVGTWADGQLCFTPGTEGAQEITVTATSDCGSDECTFTVTVAYYAAPEAGFTAVPESGPAPLMVSFTNTSTGEGLTYAWDFGDGVGTSTEENPYYTFDEGCYDVVLTVTDVCSATDDYTFEVCVTEGGAVIPSDRWIVVGCETPTLDDVALVPGDMVGARDVDGVLCGLAEVDGDGMLVLTVYGDSPYTEDVDEGPEPGEPVYFEINDVAVTADPSVTWTENGAVFEICTFLGANCVDFSFEPGWYLISWNVDYAASIEDFVALFGGCIDVVLGFDMGGLTYDPDLPQFSTLHDVDYYHGYWVRIPDGCTVDVSVCGDDISAEEVIMTYTGWNLVAYWPQDVLAPETALATVLENLMVAYTFDDGYYDFFPTTKADGSLTEMMEGFGYWLYTYADDVLAYPGFGASAAPQYNPGHPLAKTMPLMPSRTWMSVYGADMNIDGEAVANGSLVEIFHDGTLCGSGTYTDGILRFTSVYGYDAASSETQGYPQMGDQLEVQIDGVVIESDLTMGATGSRVDLSALNKTEAVIPSSFSLSQNYPNPFNPTTTISFSLPEAGQVQLALFNILGQQVNVLVDDHMSAGQHTVTWNGDDSNGSKVGSGVYFYRLTTGDFNDTKKMVLMK